MHTRWAGAMSEKLTVLLCWGPYSSCRQLVLAVSYFRIGIARRDFLATDPIAVCKPGREIMETSRHISFAILAVSVLAAGALLLEHTGLFAGVFRTEILARVDAGDVVGVGQAVTAQNISASDTASSR